jgi:hypothetical protein
MYIYICLYILFIVLYIYNTTIWFIQSQHLQALGPREVLQEVGLRLGRSLAAKGLVGFASAVRGLGAQGGCRWSLMCFACMLWICYEDWKRVDTWQILVTSDYDYILNWISIAMIFIRLCMMLLMFFFSRSSRRFWKVTCKWLQMNLFWDGVKPLVSKLPW